MKKLILFLLTAVLVLVSATVLAASSLVDDAGLLTTQQQRELLQELHKQEKLYDVRIAVVTKKEIGDAVPGEYANKLLDTVYNDGKNGNMVLLQVTSRRKWYIATDKKLKQIIIGNAGIEYMSKPMVAKFKADKYAEGYMIYAQRAGKLLAYHAAEGIPWTPKVGAQKLAAKIITTAPSPSLLDVANIFTSEQQAKIAAELQKLETEHSVRISVVTLPDKDVDKDKLTWLADELLQAGYSDGKNGSILALCIVDTTSDDNISVRLATNNKMKNIITDGEPLVRIREAMQECFEKNDRTEAVMAYAHKADELMDYYEEKSEPWSEAVEFNIFACIIAVFFAAVITSLAAFILRVTMGEVAEKAEADIYLANFALLASHDTYLRTDVTVSAKSKGGRDNHNDASGGSVSESSSDGGHGGGGGDY